ncbi:MAG TPA: VOC family protein [Solirubrobacteraceae bacterium]|nr:VOC family protein [Solirubrobacteraceae bacterium]
MTATEGVTGLEHVLVLSDDIDRAAEFYARTLGLRIGDRPRLQFTGYWLYAGPMACLHVGGRASYRAHAATLGIEVPARLDGRGPVDHVAFSAADYAAISERLERAGVDPIRREIPGGGPRQLFFESPDGIRIEINVPAGARA